MCVFMREAVGMPTLVDFRFSHQRLVSFPLKLCLMSWNFSTWNYFGTLRAPSSPPLLVLQISSHYHTNGPLSPAFRQNLKIWAHVGRLKVWSLNPGATFQPLYLINGSEWVSSEHDLNNLEYFSLGFGSVVDHLPAWSCLGFIPKECKDKHLISPSVYI